MCGGGGLISLGVISTSPSISAIGLVSVASAIGHGDDRIEIMPNQVGTIFFFFRLSDIG